MRGSDNRQLTSHDFGNIGLGLFFLFRWVFKERYSEEVSLNRVIAALICGVTTYGALMN